VQVQRETRAGAADGRRRRSLTEIRESRDSRSSLPPTRSSVVVVAVVKFGRRCRCRWGSCECE
jgi:hypothetical protein